MTPNDASTSPAATPHVPARARLTPTVGHLVTVLEARIRSGEYAPGRRLPSERALCEELSVSRPTIRQALRELERRDLIQRPLGHRPVVAGAGAGRAAAGSAGPRDGAPATRRRSVALWVSGDPLDMGPMSMTRRVYQTLLESDYRLVVACPQGNSQEEAIRSETEALHRLAQDDDIAGLILWHLGGVSNLPALRAFRDAGKPMVFVDRQPPTGFEADYVGVHNEYAAAEAVRYLISLGHRSILHVTNPDHASSVEERLEGYRRALTEAGIPYRPERVVVMDDFQMAFEGGREERWRALVTELWSRPEPPTAVFAVNDYSARSLVTALLEAGLRVPEDISVVGFDDLERWSPGVPALTSAAQPFETIGAEAARLLLHRLRQGESPVAFRHVLLPAPLVVRASCSGPASPARLAAAAADIGRRNDAPALAPA
jgi:Transcriptional regulators